MPLSLIDMPEEEAIDLENAKKQCEIVGTDDHDVFLESELIPAALARAEGATLRQLLGPTTYDWVLDGFPCKRVIELPRPPLVAVTYVKYTDTAGVLQTFAASNYTVQAPVGPKAARGRLGLVDLAAWPTDVARQIGAVVIRFTCGYGDAEDIPALLRRAMLMDVATMFDQRENLATVQLLEVPHTAREIYRSFKSHGRQWIEE